METLFACCAGLDVHQKTVWACVRKLETNGRVSKEIRSFGTMTGQLRELNTWLLERGVTHAAMESTGVLWKPIYNILSDRMEVWLCNARHIKNVPGRKTDVKDCDWIAQLMQCGLLKRSFIPLRPVRDLRDLTRTRTCLEDDKTRIVNRIHKVLEDANIKLGAVASDIMGVSGRAMLWKLIGGETDPRELAKLAKRRMKRKTEPLTQALDGIVSEHHRYMLRTLMEQVSSLERAIAGLDERVAEVMKSADEKSAAQPAAPASDGGTGVVKPPLPFLAALKLLTGIGGIKQRGAENILAELGTDMSPWATHRHITSWAGMCPGNNISAGKSISGATKKGNNWLRRALTQAAWAGSRCKKSYLSVKFKRLVRRRGAQRALVAVGDDMLISIYHMLREHTEYKDLGIDHNPATSKASERAMVRNLERLGYKVTKAA